jgi:hypothetical protein
MTHCITVRNVNDALSDALWWLKTSGIEEGSRNGGVIVAPGPVVTTYRKPRERVLFSVERDANPFFHFFESLWMLMGRNDVKFVGSFVKRMYDFSDDGRVLNGAYGFRWRNHFGYDQVEDLIDLLRTTPDTRRAVLAMWDGAGDGLETRESRDVPCNTHAYFDLRGDALNMTVCNRSNDAIWGAYGANAVHFSFLQEYMACALNVAVGTYTQFSNNLHVYRDVPNFDRMFPGVDVRDLYSMGGVRVGPPLFENEATRGIFDADLRLFFENPYDRLARYRTQFFAYTVAPFIDAHNLYKLERLHEARLQAMTIEAEDWRRAAVEWLDRRLAARKDPRTFARREDVRPA